MSMFDNAKWIWDKSIFEKNQRTNFFFDIQLDGVLTKTEFIIGCETKYRLFVNGEAVVLDGGLFRESIPGCGWYDKVDIADNLHPGNNLITIAVWYYGNGGRNNSVCSKPGLIFECSELGIYSDENTLCYGDDAYYTSDGEKPSYLYGGDNTAYDARIRPFCLCPSPDGAYPATVIGNYGDAPWGKLIERCVPMLYFTQRFSCDYKMQDGKVVVVLPDAMQFSPYIKLIASGDEMIDIRSDRYRVNGGPGDIGSYNSHRAEYICRPGEQEFEMWDWLFGESIIFTVPDGVQIIEVGYRESGYDSKVTGDFECDDVAVNRLFRKCVRTLQVCMRENYMDCPDRERGQWIGDVSVQAPQVVYLLDNNGLLLLRKSICDFINLRKGAHLMGKVPGDTVSELPSQSLNAISEIGMIATYYHATGDTDILNLVFEPCVEYLMLWDTDKDGVVLPRSGNWEWYDHLYNIDGEILNICWYYSAVGFAQTMAEILGIHKHDDFLKKRRDSIEQVFDKRYWHEDKGYYASGDFADDRANAMAVLVGLCSEKRYFRIRYLLMSVFNSSTYMENYVLSALCEMGYKEDAFRRMMCRYQPLVVNGNSTLWEDFFHLGTRNHAWSGAPATILIRYFAGVQGDFSVKDTDIYPLKNLKCTFSNRDGLQTVIEKNNTEK